VVDVVVVAAGVVSGVVSGVLSGVVSGVVSGTVVVVVVVSTGIVVVVAEQSSSADALFTGRGVDDPVVLAVLFDVGVLAELETGVELELVWPSIRCSTVNVEESCTVPSTLSVVVRSPCVTTAVLKIDAAAAATLALGLRAAIAAAAPPAKASRTMTEIARRRLR
jgi:hypothetical protein